MQDTYYDYLNHFREAKYWSAEYGLLWANGETKLKRTVPAANAYPLGSEWLNGRLINNGMDMYAIGMRSSGNGNDDKLTMSEVQGSYYHNLNPNGGGMPLNLGVNNGGGGGNGLMLNLNLQNATTNNLEIIWDHAQVSYYSRQKLLAALNHWSSFWGPNKWGSVDYEGQRASMEHMCNDYDLVPKKGMEDELKYKFIMSLPVGVVFSANQYMNWNGSMTY